MLAGDPIVHPKQHEHSNTAAMPSSLTIQTAEPSGIEGQQPNRGNAAIRYPSGVHALKGGKRDSG